MKTILERDVLARVLSRAGLEELRARLLRGEAELRVTGLMGPARSLAEAVLVAEIAQPVLLLVSDERRMSEAVADITAVLASLGRERPVLPFPSFEIDPYRGLGPHFDVAAERARALAALLEGEAAIVVAPVSAVLYRTARPDLLSTSLVRIAPGDHRAPVALERTLLQSGYLREDPVVARGDFARRGGILDVFPPDGEQPIRIEFVGDQVDQIRTFDPETQKTIGYLREARLRPAREWIFRDEQRAGLIAALRDRNGGGGALLGALERESFPPGTPFALPRLAEFEAGIFDYLGTGVALLEEPAELRHRAAAEWEKVLESYAEASASEAPPYAEPSRLLFTPEDVLEKLPVRAAALQEVDVLDGSPSLHLATQLLPSFRGRLSDFIEEIRRQRGERRQVHIFVGNRGLAERLVEILQEHELSAGLVTEGALPSGAIAIHLGNLSHGFVLTDVGQAVFAGRDVFAEPPRPERARTRKLGRFLSDFRDLKVGDFVVHADHGIGVFVELKQIALESTLREFVVLEYHGGDRLYVPVERLELLEKYSSSEGARPRVDRLGSGGWERVKRRVRTSMRDMTRELLQLYAARKSLPGHAFSPDNHWQQEFEDLFEHEETADQEQSIREVKHDMEMPFPMDRLLCGDVGYGKTEVAMRAAFKAVMDGKQAAVLVPTTVLAFQHLSTFQARFAPFPVRIEMVSRFRSAKQQKEILRDVASGAVDILIGTHRLLSKDVAFRDLGLLVVDEEHRFGVAHKERLKHLRRNVDCLTMTATPIPRTLHMSLSGIRDLSVIETPPKDRMSIQTYITRLDGKTLAEAIRYELGRGGQIYFVHDRVSSIYSIASYLQRLVPEARIGVAHGQMKETELESTMLRFIRQEFDVLVTTTIIESGVDIPLVNTLIVNRADRFGLSQLYQLRGRVGRSNRRAYAYLLIPDEAALSPLARRRLAAIREFSDLGAGFRIAALDLELRGAGNLLGGEQHGHIEAVGFDLYCRMLEESIRELSGEEPEPPRATLNLRIDLRIPESFIPDVNQRMSVYKRASTARDETTVSELAAEIRDRYGPLPDAVLQLLEYVRLRRMAEEARITAIDRESGVLAFRFDPSSPVEPARLAELARRRPGSRLTPTGVLKLEVAPGADAPEVLSMVRDVLLEISPYSKMAGRPGRQEEARR